jgi:M6 family metalloprotease-like protein
MLVSLREFLPDASAQPSLADFGYQTMRVNGQLAAGPRPLVVVLIRFDSMDFPPAYFEDYFLTNIFDPLGPHTVNGYMLENSNGRFYWSRSSHPGVIRPHPLPDSENYGPTLVRAGGQPGANNPPAIRDLTDLLFHSNLVARTMMSGLVDFRQFDGDANSVITGDELHLLFILPDTNSANGAARSPGRVQPPGFSYALHLESDCGVNVRSPFDMLTHELIHTLGAIDLYHPNPPAAANAALTLMGPNSGVLDFRQTFHLDPWHKLRLGWCEPRIRSIRDGGVEALFAAQMIRPDGQVILYDPARGTGEYFILEYRTSESPNGPGYDRNVAGNGLVIWHVQHDGNYNPLYLDTGHLSVVAEAAPDLARGSNFVWKDRAITPHLLWNDGSPTRTRIYVRSTNPNGSITVEWWSEEETWVDFNYPGLPTFPEVGLQIFPFNSLAEGVTASPWGGLVKLKSGSSAETIVINKRVTLEAVGGQVIIGGLQ